MNAPSEPTYFSVGRNGTWTTEPAPASFFTSRGATISPSRIHPEGSGIMTLWIDGTNAGTLFPNQADQIAHLKAAGLLSGSRDPAPSPSHSASAPPALRVHPPTLVIDMLVTTTVRVPAPHGWESMSPEQLREAARRFLERTDENELRAGIEEFEAVPDQVSIEHGGSDRLDTRYTSPAFTAYMAGGINTEPISTPAALPESEQAAPLFKPSAPAARSARAR